MFNSGFKSVAYFPFSVLLWLSKAEVLKHFAWARKFLQYSVFSLERIKSHKSCTRASCLQSVSPGYRPKSEKKSVQSMDASSPELIVQIFIIISWLFCRYFFPSSFKRKLKKKKSFHHSIKCISVYIRNKTTPKPPLYSSMIYYCSMNCDICIFAQGFMPWLFSGDFTTVMLLAQSFFWGNWYTRAVLY